MAAILPEGSWIRPVNHDPYHRGAQWRVPRQALVGCKRHVNDPYVKQAQKDGYRSRASYKLLEVQEKYQTDPSGHDCCRPGRGARWLVAGRLAG